MGGRDLVAEVGGEDRLRVLPRARLVRRLPKQATQRKHLVTDKDHELEVPSRHLSASFGLLCRVLNP